MKSLFPYFGGKSSIADVIWKHLGDVGSYVEPFFGSGAGLAARPHRVTPSTHVELVNDLNGWLVNAWRSVQHDPESVMRHLQTLSYSEADLRAAKRLVYSKDLSEQLEDLDWHDARIGAYWLAIMCGFVATDGGSNNAKGSLRTGNKGQGVHRPDFSLSEIEAWSHRMQRVRIMQGPWQRCVSSRGRMCGFSSHEVGVYLDPPYTDGTMDTYGERHDATPALESAQWAVEHGDDPAMRIIYSGYEGTVEFPDTWRVIEWKASEGYGRTGGTTGRENAHRERLWLSPHCLDDPQPTLF